jgi:hypothetical protein
LTVKSRPNERSNRETIMPELKINPALCPLCGKPNQCARLQGAPEGACWCVAETFSAELLALVPAEKKGKACICRDCLQKHRLKSDA